MPGMKTLTGMTGTGSAVELAEMLRQLGRGRDTVLAHITPEEAQMLMDRGGSGTINPNTGLPEFLDIYGGDFGAEPAYDVEAQPEGFYGQTPTATFNPQTQETRLYRDSIFNAQPEQGSFENFYRQNLRGTVTPSPMGPELTPPPYSGDAESQFGGFYGGRAPSAEEFARVQTALQPQIPEPGLAQKAESGLQQVRELTAKYPRLTQALGAGAQGIAALVQARRARQQGQEQAARFAELGRPLREEAENLRQQALSGTLTPQQAAQQEAIRARMRQAAASRGVTTGTQAAMIENQLSRARAELSQTNLNNALRQLNLANAYDEAAIKASLAADREADELLADIFQNIARDISGARTVTPQASRMTTAQLPTQEVTRRPEIPRG
jgi:hypothetical protein